ncbi:T9SS type A sorting domain-containing protein [Flavobacterium sp. WC2430]|uniref:T9SS type A sorting domain-containing protein n=1 Tax=Flavobacterium sp. WC2430 TaxID=3234137 RepID=UPI0034656117
MSSKILRNTTVIIIGFLFLHDSNAQMFVSPNSSVFVNNEVVFIKNELELKGATSNFYLRKDAQLLQGTTTASANKGLGTLSVFQEGTTNNFQYNYWCSPVGGSSATVGNTAFGITQLMDVVDLTNSNSSTILPSNNYNGASSPLAIAPYWIWKLPANSTSNWVYVGSGSTLNTGEGFTMKGTSGINSITVNGVQNNSGSKQRYDFRGKPNDGTISIPVVHEELTLTGNPYPSAIDLAAFLTNATNSTGIAYFWEQDKTVNSHYIADYKGGYGAYSPLGGSGNGVYTPATFYSYDGSGNEVISTGSGVVYGRRFSPVGQGFMIEGKVNGIVEMKNSYRVYVKEGASNSSEFEKNANIPKTVKSNSFLSTIQSVSGFDYTTINTTPPSQIRLNTLLNGQGVRQLVLAFVPEATDGVDHAMDALSTSDNDQADIYFVLNENEYIIDAVQFGIDKKIPLGFKNQAQANYKISVKEIINFTETENVYLHDKTSDAYFDIKNSFYEVDLPAGVNNTQFEITFKNGSTLGVEDVNKEKFLMYQNNKTKSLTLSNPLQKELVSCSLYDVLGKLIFNKKDLGTNATYSFTTANLSDGIYFAKLATNENAIFNQKIIIKN